MSLCAHLAERLAERSAGSRTETACFVCFRQERQRLRDQSDAGQDGHGVLPLEPVPPPLNERQIAHRRVMLANFERRVTMSAP